MYKEMPEHFRLWPAVQGLVDEVTTLPCRVVRTERSPKAMGDCSPLLQARDRTAALSAWRGVLAQALAKVLGEGSMAEVAWEDFTAVQWLPLVIASPG
jgi:hypothetical protein